jgi:hypothetical protein
MANHTVLQFSRKPIPSFNRFLADFIRIAPPVMLLGIANFVILWMNFTPIWIPLLGAAPFFLYGPIQAWNNTRIYLTGMKMSSSALTVTWLESNKPMEVTIPTREVRLSIEGKTWAWMDFRQLVVAKEPGGVIFKQNANQGYTHPVFQEILKNWRQTTRNN